ncbi:MAG: pentapeptide repeat-containing protein [Phycisphaerae bacterium]|nr:pentapeptide repeat-containing protein [Phycisphaerae bacterium]
MNRQDKTYNKTQYDLLKKCSKKKDVTEWNNWRKKNPREKVILTGVNLSSFELVDANLENADLRGAQLFNTNLSNTNLRGANLEEAYLVETILNSAVLTKVTFKSAILTRVKANNSNFDYADFENASIKIPEIENCTFIGANFSYTNISDNFIRKCDLKNSIFIETIAKNVDFKYSDFSNVIFNNANLSQSNLWYAKFNVDEIKKAKRLFHAKFLLEDYNDYLSLKEKDILFCYEKQYKWLLECSEKKDLSEWNEWNPHTGYKHTGRMIYLAGADLEKLFLEKVRLGNADLREARFIGTNLKGALLDEANMEGAYMNGGPCLDGAFLDHANLKNAWLGSACFRNARLFGADLENTDLCDADFSMADLRRANLKNTKSILAANFEKARMEAVNLEGANLYKCNFSGTDFHRGIVDGTTSMYQCQVDRETDFRCVSLDSIGIDSTTKRLLEYNIRRKNWSDWYWQTTYEEGKKFHSDHGPKKEIMWKNITRFIITLPVRGFWWISDYGTNPLRILKVSIAIWFVFTLIYFSFPKCIENLCMKDLTVRKGKICSIPTRMQLFWRSAYFSASTMIIFGSGDMYPKPYGKAQLIVIVQGFIAYFLLAELVTFLGILFTSGGPFLIYMYPHAGFP